MDERTPVLIGAGQFTYRGDPAASPSPTHLLKIAAERAAEDAGIGAAGLAAIDSLVVVGFTSGRIPDAPANHLLVKNYSVVGLHWGLYRKHDPALSGMVHEELTRLYAEGHIDPLVSQVLPLDQAPQAMHALADRSTVGKVVLVP